MSDERKNLPSASSMERYQLCPGSWRAEQGQPDETSEDAETGNRIHAALAGEVVTPPLTDDEERVAKACGEQLWELLESTGCLRRVYTEERLWSLDGRWSGKPDVATMKENGLAALVVDYKTGRGDVTDATSNLQLRALAVLVSDEVWADEVTVAIVQPLAGPVSTCTYDSAALDVARAEITGIIDAIQKPDAPRIPSAKACQYCKAKAICPEARNASVAMPMSNIPAGTTPDAIAATLTSETLAEFLERAQFATKVIDACRDEARRRIQAGESVPGWKLKPGSERETITDPTTVFNRASLLGVNAEAFMGCVSVAKGKLKDAVKLATGDKGKALDERMQSVVYGCIELKRTAPSLVKIREGA